MAKETGAKERPAVAWENPLVPHAALRRMHALMLELRRREPGAVARRRGAVSRRGEEAVLASSLLSLGDGDLLSEAAGTGPARELAMEGLGLNAGVRRLPAVGDGTDRVIAAMGAASAMRGAWAADRPEAVKGDRSGAGSRLVLVYVRPGELSGAQWKKLLGMAGAGSLPVIFAVLPTPAKVDAVGRRAGWLSERAQGWGVPGIPVDASDAVALFRVMQEGALRARGGDGPTLLEAIAWRPEGRRRAAEADPLRAMETVLRDRGLLAASYT